MDPKISIIVPVYKVEKYLRRCVESIINQSYTNIEIILVDDGSPDGCGEICEKYAQQDIRIKVIHKRNGGLSDARNIALDCMKGEYVTFIDSDDFVEPKYVEILYDLAKKYDVKLSISNFTHYFENKDEEKNDNLIIRTESFSSEKGIETMFYQNKFETSAWGKLYHKNLFLGNTRYPKGMLYEDLPTTYKLILKAGNVAYTNQQTYYYLIRKDSIQCSEFNEKKLDILKVADMMITDITNNYPVLLPSLKCRLFSAYLNVFLQIEPGNKYENIFWDRICAYRFSNLTNLNARKKAIGAAFISLFGKSALRYFFNFINIRN